MWKSRCERKGHDWFPPLHQLEFIPTQSLCFRCGKTKFILPIGQCLGGHPLAEHYDEDGTVRPVAGCLTNGPN